MDDEAGALRVPAFFASFRICFDVAASKKRSFSRKIGVYVLDAVKFPSQYVTKKGHFLKLRTWAAFLPQLVRNLHFSEGQNVVFAVFWWEKRTEIDLNGLFCPIVLAKNNFFTY